MSRKDVEAENGDADWPAPRLDPGGCAYILLIILFQADTTPEASTEIDLFTMKTPRIEATFSRTTKPRGRRKTSRFASQVPALLLSTGINCQV